MYNCTPTVFFRGTESFVESFLKVNLKKFQQCNTFSQLLCVNTQSSATFRSANFKLNCSQCIQPCYETTYDFLVSQQKFPSHHTEKYFLNLSNTSNISEFRKSFILANFVYESMTVLTVYENQAYTVSDLFFSIGGTVGLFLGMSFLSFGDVFQLIFLFIHRLVWKCRYHKQYKRKQNKVVVNNVRKYHEQYKRKPNKIVVNNVKKHEMVKELVKNIKRKEPTKVRQIVVKPTDTNSVP